MRTEDRKAQQGGAAEGVGGDGTSGEEEDEDDCKRCAWYRGATSFLLLGEAAAVDTELQHSSVGGGGAAPERGPVL